nr:hypothetical protein [Tanacetum cinerariifolium]
MGRMRRIEEEAWRLSNICEATCIVGSPSHDRSICCKSSVYNLKPLLDALVIVMMWLDSASGRMRRIEEEARHLSNIRKATCIVGSPSHVRSICCRPSEYICQASPKCEIVMAIC